MHVIEEKTEGNVTLKIVVDEDPTSPREWDNLGEILYVSSRYTLGDRKVDAEEIQAIQEDKDNLWLPVYAYIHGGTSLNTGGFGDPWDSGTSGIIYVSKEKILKEWKVKRISPKLRATVLEGLKGEVKTYSDYLEGNVYGHVIEVDGEQVDSCWGHYGSPRDLLKEFWPEALSWGASVAKEKAKRVQSASRKVREELSNLVGHGLEEDVIQGILVGFIESKGLMGELARVLENVRQEEEKKEEEEDGADA
jgi:hypothetical protein